MDQQTRKNISKATSIIQKKFDIHIPITDMDSIVARLHGRIEEIDDYSADSTITKIDEADAMFVIKVSSQQSIGRRNFSIAQKLGNLFLHMGYMTDWDLWETADTAPTALSSTEREFEAHEFAAHFLMPKQAFQDYVYDNTKDNIVDAHEIALHFGVSDTVAINHGKWLGVLKWE